MEFGQFRNKGRREQKGAGGEKLSQFDEGRPQFLKGAAQSLGWREEGNLFLGLAQFAKGQTPGAGQGQAFGQIAIAVFEKHANDGAKAMHMFHRPPESCEAT